MAKSRIKRAVLVFQGGMANVFAVESFNMTDYGRDARRLLQGDFQTCSWYARGLADGGAEVRAAWCNMAGDIVREHWNDDFESDQPPFFRDVCIYIDPLTNHLCGR